MRSIAVLVVALSLGQSASESLRAGLMVSTGEANTAAIEGAPLKAGTPVTVVIDRDRQEVRPGTIGRRLAASERLSRHDLEGPYYEIIGEVDEYDLGTVAIVVIGRAEVTRVANSVRLRLKVPPTEVQARSCASSEGVHFTLWAGVPLKSRRLWHAYLYAGYDTESTCTPEDYGGG